MNKTTVNDLIAELDDARQLAKKIIKPSAMISTTLTKARLLGRDTGVNHNDIAQPVKVVIQVADAENHDRQLIN